MSLHGPRKDFVSEKPIATKSMITTLNIQKCRTFVVGSLLSGLCFVFFLLSGLCFVSSLPENILSQLRISYF